MKTTAPAPSLKAAVPAPFRPSLVRGKVLQRKCACGGTPGPTGECEACRKKRLQRYSSDPSPSVISLHRSATLPVPPIVHSVLGSPGRPLDAQARAFMEPHFAHDFSRVRIHTDGQAANSARAVNAVAYTVGHHVVFDSEKYAPRLEKGRRLLAHELAHVVQQESSATPSQSVIAIDHPDSVAEREAENAARAISANLPLTMGVSVPPQLARATCTPASVCGGGPVAGSAQEADVTGTTHEVGPRARRKTMTPARAIATGHSGRALALEKFMQVEAPGKLSTLQGVFVDQDIATDFEATTTSCAGWIADSLPSGSPTPPGMAGATKPCTFVHDNLNQQAQDFNTTTDATIGGKPRARWRAETFETLVHESEHPRFEAATGTLPRPPGVTSATCQRANLLQELSELAAILSEFPTAFDAASSETNPHGPLHQSLNAWFDCKIQSCGENIKSALTQMGCQCSCPEVDAFVIETFNFESGSWNVSQRDAFHRELTKPKWGLKWPLRPSVP
jgi:hypothetical protein